MVRRSAGAGWVAALLAILCALAVSLLLFQAVSNFGRDVPHSAIGAGPTGLKAVRLLLEERGFQVNLLDRPLSEGGDLGDLLFVIEPARPLNDSDRSAALEGVRKGLTLIVVGDAALPFLRTLDEHVRPSNTDDVYLAPQVAAPFLPGVPDIFVTSDLRLAGATQPFVQYFGDEHGGVVRGYRTGKGRIIVISDPELFSNRVVYAEPSNALLALGMARAYAQNGSLAFAEFYHGLGRERRSAQSELIPAFLRYSFRQVLLVLLLGLLAASWRFGRPIPLPSTGRRSIAEYMNSVGNLYRRAGARDVALEGLYRNLLRVLREYCGFERDVPPAQLAEECARRRGSDATEIRRLLERCSEALSGRRNLDEKALFSLARQIDRCRKEYERSGFGK